MKRSTVNILARQACRNGPTMTGFKKSFKEKWEIIRPPIDLVPENMLETRVFEAWKGWFYCIEFRKPGEGA